MSVKGMKGDRRALAGLTRGVLVVAFFFGGGCSGNESSSGGAADGGGAAAGGSGGSAGTGGGGGSAGTGGGGGSAGTGGGGGSAGTGGSGGSAGTGGGGGSAGTGGSGGADAGLDASDGDGAAGDGGGAGGDAGAGEAGGGGGADGGIGAGTVGPTLTQFTPSGPVTLSSGDTIEGLDISNPSGPCIYGSGVSNVRIANNRIGPCGPGQVGNGITLENGGSHVLIEHNAIDDVASAFYRVGNGDDVVFDHNYVTRVRGPMPRGQMVQFNQVTGAGNRITCNVSDQTTPGYGDGPEDHVNPFSTSGTSTSPLLIAYNKLRGGGPSTSGGGILAGDYDGEYVEIRQNILVNPGQYGVAIAGGRHHRLIDNIVYAPDSFPWSNNGLFVWGQYDNLGPCSDHEVRGNRVYYVNKNQQLNAGWNAGNCGTIAGWSENDFADATLTMDVWNTVIPECQ